MSLQSCTRWLDDCGLSGFGIDQLFRLLLRDNGDGCPAVEVVDNSSTENITVGDTGRVLIEDAALPGLKSLNGLYTAYDNWKAANATKKIVSELHVMGGDGVPGIIINYKL